MAVTPGIEEGGKGQDAVKNSLRNKWKKLVECEERLRFWKRMVGKGMSVRELAHIGEDIKNKFRSESMKEGNREQEVVNLVMMLKLKDERRHAKELKERRNETRKELESLVESSRQFKKIIKMLNKEATNLRKVERCKYNKKAVKD